MEVAGVDLGYGSDESAKRRMTLLPGVTYGIPLFLWRLLTGLRLGPVGYPWLDWGECSAGIPGVDRNASAR